MKKILVTMLAISTAYSGLAVGFSQHLIGPSTRGNVLGLLRSTHNFIVGSLALPIHQDHLVFYGTQAVAGTNHLAVFQRGPGKFICVKIHSPYFGNPVITSGGKFGGESNEIDSTLKDAISRCLK